METELNAIIEQARQSMGNVDAQAAFESEKAKLVGPSGSFTDIRKSIGKLPKEQRPEAGKLLNQAKTKLEAIFDEVKGRLRAAEIAAKIGDPVDVTLASADAAKGSFHLLTQIREELCSIMRKVGFTVAEGPELETEWYCFDALNTPAHHPARDAQDTYYLNPKTEFGNVSQKDDERYLLRTHTSTVQIREMLANKPPIRIVSPGRCYRRDTTDATHSASFHQMEALCVDEGVSIKDLKAILDYMFQSLLGKGAVTRFRPHFFPYTEPSFEIDFNCSHIKRLNREWVEIGGCGMVDPAVFESVGYNPKKWSGYAFGFGLERIAMILHGVDDIRHFYQNDQRFLSQFK